MLFIKGTNQFLQKIVSKGNNNNIKSFKIYFSVCWKWTIFIVKN